MQDPRNQSACGDPAFERSLLEAAKLSEWKGFPIAWIEATPHIVHADLVTDRNALVMIDTGMAGAEFCYRKKSMSWEFTPGSIGLFTVGTELSLSKWKWTPTRRIRIDLDSPLPGGEGLLDTLNHFPKDTEIEFRDEELSSVLRSMAVEVATGCPHGQLFAESLSLGVAMRLHQRAHARYATARERGKLTAAQLRRLRELVDTHLARDIGLSTLARASGFSPAQFVRLVRNTLGCTPHQFVVRARLERARQLVLTSDMSLATIAAETGFSSQSHMTSAFARAFNAPPGEMRRAARRLADDTH